MFIMVDGSCDRFNMASRMTVVKNTKGSTMVVGQRRTIGEDPLEGEMEAIEVTQLMGKKSGGQVIQGSNDKKDLI